MEFKLYLNRILLQFFELHFAVEIVAIAVRQYIWRCEWMFLTLLFCLLQTDESTYGFETPSKQACKHLWKCCVEHHAFFRLVQVTPASTENLFALGSRFRYRWVQKRQTQKSKRTTSTFIGVLITCPSGCLQAIQNNCPHDKRPLKTQLRGVKPVLAVPIHKIKTYQQHAHLSVFKN
jgi:hypothetical protein